MRRADYSASGIKRLLNADTRSTFTLIELEAEKVGKIIAKRAKAMELVLRDSTDKPLVLDLGGYQEVVVMQGFMAPKTESELLTAENRILDLDFASKDWYKSGAITIIWQNQTLTCQFGKLDYNEVSGIENFYNWIMDFKVGDVIEV